MSAWITGVSPSSCIIAAAAGSRLICEGSMYSFASGQMRAAISAAVCLAASSVGFTPLVHSGYPVLGALCMALMILLCLPDDLFPRLKDGL